MRVILLQILLCLVVMGVPVVARGDIAVKYSHHVTEAIDPDGHVALVFTDFRGFKLLERRVLGDGKMLDTYYICDAWGNPLVVVQPEGAARLTGKGAAWSIVSEDILMKYAFIYRYDDAMRVVSKKLPGCEPVTYTYDPQGQLAFSQDGNQRDAGRRMFYLYDTAGRPTVTGECDAPAGTWPVAIDTPMQSRYVERVAGVDSTFYSTDVALAAPKMLNVWYYDTYPRIPRHPLDYGVVRNGLVTVSATALLPAQGWQDRLFTVNYYDWEDRLAESTTDIPGGGTIQTKTNYTLTDQIDSVWTTIRMPGRPVTVDRYKYRYDHADRVKSVTLYHDNDAPRVLAVNDYDPLGRLAKAHLPGETVTYTYNIRNALTAISSPRFTQSLYYADLIMNEGKLSKPCYNGNISAIVSGGAATHYTYDHANRLTEAKYLRSGLVINPAGMPDYSASYSYDLNSNITELTRYGLKTLTKYGVVDDLTMTYDGNQLTKIEDAADEVLLENSYDVKSPSVTLRPVDFPLPQFSYDANGNTTRDQSRNLYSISYNALNLPECIIVSSSSSSKLLSTIDTPSISYRYDGGGGKHEVVHSRIESIATGLGGSLKVARHDTTRYVGSHIYENGRLDRILTPYGYLKDGVHHTYLHDYQGNVVAVVAGDSLVQQTSYYPYGLPHAKSTNATANRYKYGGKELDTFGGINLADFHARQSNLSGRFLTVDPHAESYYGYSVYLYCFGNPINASDFTGMDGDWLDNIEEAIADMSIGVRSEGALQVMGGAAEMCIGAGAIGGSCGAASVIGSIAVVHGADQVSTGLQKLITGKDSSSLTSQAMQSAGMSKWTADAIDSGLGEVLSMGSAVSSLVKSTSTAKAIKSADDVPLPTKIGETGKIGEQRLAEYGGKAQVRFETPAGRRYVDRLANKIAHEAKVGYTPLTEFTSNQIAKDAYLIGNKQVNGAMWHFYRSPVTGKVGPSQPLVNELNKHKIPYIIHD